VGAPAEMAYLPAAVITAMAEMDVFARQAWLVSWREKNFCIKPCLGYR